MWLLWSGWPFVFGLLATPVQVIVGRQYIVGAWKALRNRSANMDTLIAMGSLAAYLYSLVVLVGIAPVVSGPGRAGKLGAGVSKPPWTA